MSSAGGLVVFVTICFIANVARGAFGFGAGVIFVAVGLQLFSAHDVVVLTAIVDLIGNSLARFSRQAKDISIPYRVGPVFWIAAFIGALISLAEQLMLQAAIAVALVLSAVAAIKRRISRKPYTQTESGISATSLAVSGFAGGLCGLAGPFLALFLDRRFTRDTVSIILVETLLWLSICRCVGLLLAGAIDWHHLLYMMISMPAVYGGVKVGQYYGNIISERIFYALFIALCLISGTMAASRAIQHFIG